MEWLIWITRWFLFCRINDRFLLKIKDGYKLELQTPKTIKLFDSKKKLIDKTKKTLEMYQELT